jgi:hypothetical protein
MTSNRNIPTGCEDYQDYELVNAREYLQVWRELQRRRSEEMVDSYLAEDEEEGE